MGLSRLVIGRPLLLAACRVIGPSAKSACDILAIVDEAELLALAASTASSDPIKAQTVAAVVAEAIAALACGDEFDPEEAAALVGGQEHCFRPRPPELLAAEIYQLRRWQRLVVAARDRLAGPRQRLLQTFNYDINTAVTTRGQAITGPVGTLSGGWPFTRPDGLPVVLLTAQLPPDLRPWPDGGLAFPLWRDRASAEAALADLLARPSTSDYRRGYRTGWTCFQVDDIEQGHIIIDEDFWASR